MRETEAVRRLAVDEMQGECGSLFSRRREMKERRQKVREWIRNEKKSLV